MKKKYMDKGLSPKDRARYLLKDMSIEEKMAQVVCYFPTKPYDFSELNENYPDGAGQVSCLMFRMLESLEEVSDYQRKIQEMIMSKSEHNIPAIFHMEGVCGAHIQDAVSFPTNIARGSSFDPELEEKIAEIISRQERAVGISHIFAPVLDVARDPRLGRQGEAYGEDPTLVSALGSAFVKGVQSKKTNNLKSESVAKHFAGSHAPEGGIHGAKASIAKRELREIYSKPFQAAICESNLRGIMPCYNTIDNIPVSVSEEIMTNLLRKEMGFKGITVSDYCAISNVHETQKLYESYTEAGYNAMKAGMDMELQFKKCFNDELTKWFKENKIDISILDNAVERILMTKFRMGLFENPFGLKDKELKEAFYCKKDEDISLESAKESLVLIKNDGTLPISKDIKKIAVIGAHADDARIFFGGYTHFSMSEGLLAHISTMAGVETKGKVDKSEIDTIPGTVIQKSDLPEFEKLLQKQKPGIRSMVEYIKDKLPQTEIVYSYGYPVAGNDESNHEEALQVAKDSDLVILTLGGKYGTSSIASMGEGIDAANINLPECQEKFIEKLAKLNKKAVGIHFDGRPISSDIADEKLNSIIEAWNPAEKGGEAIVSVLLGEYNPSGKLPLSVAYNSGQIPVYYNHQNNSSYDQRGSIAFSDYVDLPHVPRYYFGHGLSYTTFEYSNLKIINESDDNIEEIVKVSPDNTIFIEVDIENTGKVGGTEVVQLYLKDCYASMSRPVKELAGFVRVKLSPNQKKTISFELSPSQLAFLDTDMNWKIEKGKVEVQIGSSSEDIRGKGAFEIIEDLIIEGKSREFYAKAIIK